MKSRSSSPRTGRGSANVRLNPGRIICGDALVELQKLSAGSVQLVIADPPYFQVLDHAWDQQWPDATAYLHWSQTWLAEAMRALREDGLLYCFGQPGKREHTFLHLLSAATQRWPFHDLITWDRVVGYRERRDSFTPATELILVQRKSAKPKFTKPAMREPYDAATIKEFLRDKRYHNEAGRRRHLAAGKFATKLWRIPASKAAPGKSAGIRRRSRSSSLNASSCHPPIRGIWCWIRFWAPEQRQWWHSSTDAAGWESKKIRLTSGLQGKESKRNPTAEKNGRGGEIRTHDLLYPKQARDQATLRPDAGLRRMPTCKKNAMTNFYALVIS